MSERIASNASKEMTYLDALKIYRIDKRPSGFISREHEMMT